MKILQIFRNIDTTKWKLGYFKSYTHKLKLLVSASNIEFIEVTKMTKYRPTNIYLVDFEAPVWEGLNCYGEWFYSSKSAEIDTIWTL